MSIHLSARNESDALAILKEKAGCLFCGRCGEMFILEPCNKIHILHLYCTSQSDQWTMYASIACPICNNITSVAWPVSESPTPFIDWINVYNNVTGGDD